MTMANTAATKTITRSIGDPRSVGSPSVEVAGARDQGIGVFLGDDEVVPGGGGAGRGVEGEAGGT